MADNSSRNEANEANVSAVVQKRPKKLVARSRLAAEGLRGRAGRPNRFFSLVTTPRDLGSGEKKHLVRSAGLWKSEVDAEKLITL